MARRRCGGHGIGAQLPCSYARQQAQKVTSACYLFPAGRVAWGRISALPLEGGSSSRKSKWPNSRSRGTQQWRPDRTLPSRSDTGLLPHFLATGIAPVDKNRPVLLHVQYRGHEARGQFALGTLRRLGRAEISRWSLTTHLTVMRVPSTKPHIRSAIKPAWFNQRSPPG